jgi:hypothetical protein
MDDRSRSASAALASSRSYARLHITSFAETTQVKVDKRSTSSDSETPFDTLLSLLYRFTGVDNSHPSAFLLVCIPLDGIHRQHPLHRSHPLKLTFLTWPPFNNGHDKNYAQPINQ